MRKLGRHCDKPRLVRWEELMRSRRQTKHTLGGRVPDSAVRMGRFVARAPTRGPSPSRPVGLQQRVNGVRDRESSYVGAVDDGSGRVVCSSLIWLSGFAGASPVRRVVETPGFHHLNSGNPAIVCGDASS
jgi:hypothetical protein